GASVFSGLQCDLLFRRPLSVGHSRTGVSAVCTLPRNTGYTGSAEQAQKMKVYQRLSSPAPVILISHLNLYPTPTSVTMCSGSDGFFSIFRLRVAINTLSVPASTPSAYPHISFSM